MEFYPSSRRTGLMTTIAAAAIAGAGGAWGATPPYFNFADASVMDSGALRVDFDEVVPVINIYPYQLVALGTATYACLKGGVKKPQVSSTENVSGELKNKTLIKTKKANVTSFITAGPPVVLQQPSCPPGYRFVLACVSYASGTDPLSGDVKYLLTDSGTRDNITPTPEPAQRTFFEVAGCPVRSR